MSFQLSPPAVESVLSVIANISCLFSSDRMADFAYTGLKDLFSVENFTAAATDDTGSGESSSGTGDSGSASGSSSDTSGSGSASEDSSSSSTGAIAGGVVGGVAGAALIGAAVFFLLRRRRAKRAALQHNIEGAGAGEKTYYGTGGHDATYSQVPHAEMPGQVPRRAEVAGTMPQAELPASQQRYELS